MPEQKTSASADSNAMLRQKLASEINQSRSFLKSVFRKSNCPERIGSGIIEKFENLWHVSELPIVKKHGDAFILTDKMRRVPRPDIGGMKRTYATFLNSAVKILEEDMGWKNRKIQTPADITELYGDIARLVWKDFRKGTFTTDPMSEIKNLEAETAPFIAADIMRCFGVECKLVSAPGKLGMQPMLAGNGKIALYVPGKVEMPHMMLKAGAGASVFIEDYFTGEGKRETRFYKTEAAVRARYPHCHTDEFSVNAPAMNEFYGLDRAQVGDKFKEALKYYDLAIKQAPDWPNLYLQRAGVYIMRYQRDDLAKAEKDIGKAIALDPDYPGIQKQLQLIQSLAP